LRAVFETVDNHGLFVSTDVIDELNKSAMAIPVGHRGTPQSLLSLGSLYKQRP
jgi:hypothetical protein